MRRAHAVLGFKALGFAAHKMLVREQSSSAQQAVAGLLRAIVESTLLPRDELDCKGIAASCMDFVGNSKVGATAKEHVYALLGRLVELFPIQMRGEADIVFRSAMHDLGLEIEAANSGQAVKAGVVSGCLRAANSILGEYVDFIEKDASIRAKLFQ